MINLTSTSDLLELVTGSALVLNVHASWVDLASTTVTPGRTNTSISSTTTTTIVASPASSTQRNVKTITIRNTDASSIGSDHGRAHRRHDRRAVDQSDAAGRLHARLQRGRGLVGLRPERRAREFACVRPLAQDQLSHGHRTFTTGPTTNTIDVELIASGGAGGGCTSVASAAAAAGGGGAGGYARKVFAVTPNTNYSYTVGTSAAGVSGAAGGNGSASTFTVGATTVTANGGTGGPVAAAATTLTSRAGGAGGVISTNGDINAGGAPGEAGNVLIVTTPIVQSGNGGSTDFGAGGLGLVAVGAGNTAVGYGGGGGGAATGASTVRTGGTSGAGLIVVREYS